MGRTANTFLTAVPVILFALVVTQLTYFALSSSGQDINRPVIWTVEACGFLGLSVVSLMTMARHKALAPALAAIAISGIVNVVQLGLGLTMFEPLSQAGESLAPVYRSVLAMAFYLYFVGKLLFGFAALVVGVHLLRAGGAARAAGALAAVAGLAAMVTNVGAMAAGMAMVFPAGAAGTAATFMLATGLAMVVRRPVGN